MAEVQTNTETGEMTQRFIEFVMMHAQNAALFLGQIPNPRGGQPEINLDIARMFIDQLVMIRSKTNGNLSNEEQGILNNTISNLQVTFFEVSEKAKAPGTDAGAAPAAEKVEETQDGPPAAGADAPAAGDDAESKKKFSKSYGAS